MPGHKRKKRGPFADAQEYDITEITGYDNLHNPSGIIRESMDMLRSVYKSRESWYLVNGSTVGILASLLSVCEHGDRIIMGRNCHKSVYHAVGLLHLHPIYVVPEVDPDYGICSGYSPDQIRKLVREYPDVKAVILTSPTYEGVVSDVRSLKDAAANIPLIVDEAHGAHFIFDDYFPDSAVECGADLVIQSTHKTLPSLTQTAVLHLCSDLVSRDRIHKSLEILETSSPSYLLMSSAEYGIAYMNEMVDIRKNYVDNLEVFRQKCGQLNFIRLIDNSDERYYDYDRGRLVFYVREKGRQLFSNLRDKYSIEMEMSSLSYVTAITSVWDDPEDYDNLWSALQKEDRTMYDMLRDKQSGNIKEREDNSEKTGNFEEWNRIPERVFCPWECDKMENIRISLAESPGRIAARDLMIYPPGSPFVVAGERIVPEILETINRYIDKGHNVVGVEQGFIEVLKEEL